MRSARQALAAVERVIARWDSTVTQGGPRAEQIRAILADVEPEPAPAGVREPTDAQVAAFKREWEEFDEVARHEGIPLPPGARTRQGLRAALELVRPVDGVVLSPEEVRRVLLWFGEGGSSARDVALAERLEKEAGQ